MIEIKKHSPLISIIIPVYNVELYLRKCLDTIIGQDYSNLEIILVDDGSKDKSGNICDEYAKRDRRVRTVHKQNGGLSSARNAGLSIFTGEYVTFVDSDDWVSKDYVSYMYSLLNRYNASIAVAKFQVVSSKDGSFANSRVKECSLENVAAVRSLLYQNISTSACCKLYKREVFETILFPENRLYEDVIPIYLAFKNAKKIALSNKKLYAYYKRAGSITKHFSAAQYNYVENCRELMKYIEKDYPSLIQAAESRLVWADIHIIVHINDISKWQEMYLELMDEIRKYRGSILKDNNNKLIVRGIVLVSYGGYKTLQWLFYMKERIIKFKP